MKVEIGEIIYMPYDGSRSYFVVAKLSFLDNGDKAFLMELPLTKNPKTNHPHVSWRCSDFSKQTNNLEVREENNKYYVEIPDAFTIDEEKCIPQRSSRWEYGRDLYHGLYYLNETLENPTRRLDM